MALRGMGRTAGSVLATAALSLAAASCGSGGLPTSGSFTFHWKSTNTVVDSGTSLKPIPFSGTVAGIPVTGSATNPASLASQLGSAAETGGLASLPKNLDIAKWRGTFDAKRFVVTVIVGDFSAFVKDPSQAVLRVTGTYGKDPVEATVSEKNVTATTVDFSGSIGTRHLHGVITSPSSGGTNGTAHGTFTLSG